MLYNDDKINYVNKINKDIEEIETIYINQHYKISEVKNNELNNILKEINYFRNNKIIPDNKFWKKLHKLSTNPGGFISIKNRKEIYSFILEILSKENKYKINIEKITKEKEEKDELTIKNDCLRSVFFRIIKEDNIYNKYILNNKNIVDIYIQELMSFTKESLGNYTYFNYFQGYQELCLYFMIIFGR